MVIVIWRGFYGILKETMKNMLKKALKIFKNNYLMNIVESHNFMNKYKSDNGMKMFYTCYFILINVYGIKKDKILHEEGQFSCERNRLFVT